MAGTITTGKSKAQQFFISVITVLLVAAICYTTSELIGYKTVALILLATVSVLAMFLSIWPVLCAAVLSALIWNFFFIPPHFTFHINNTEDTLMFLMYFLIALVNAVLTNKIRTTEKQTQQKEGEENTLKLYNTLLNSLSHELKTPIATIIGATDNLQTENIKLTESNRKDLTAEIAQAAWRLNRQVENLLNMSRLESGVIAPKRDWCDINEIAYEVVNRLKDDYHTHPFIVSIKEDVPLFKIDHGLVEQIIYNLAVNAAVYTPKHAIITIKAFSQEEHLVLIVQDNGNGFPEDAIEKVFDKFYRVKYSAAGGTGLGLSIVKGFVEAQGGSVTLTNIPEGGAKFTIVIPAETTYLKNLKNE